MAKVIPFSRQFPKGHIRAGEPTYFVEQILNNLGIKFWHDEYYTLLNGLNPGKEELIMQFYYSLIAMVTDEKPHTIRAGKRWNAGEKASLRVWSGKPYNSPQIIFAHDVEIVKTYDFEIDGQALYVGDLPFPLWIYEEEKLAENDGLSYDDFNSWFKIPTEFAGQVICWNDPKY